MGLQLPLKVPVNRIVGVPFSYESYVRSFTIVKELDDQLHVMCASDPPLSDELLEYLTVCIYNNNGQAQVQVIVDAAIYNDESFAMGSEHKLKLGAFTEIRVVDAIPVDSKDTQDSEAGLYNARYERNTLLEETYRKMFVVGKMEQVRLSKMLAVAFEAAHKSSSTPDSNIHGNGNGNSYDLEFAKEYCKSLLEIEDDEMLAKIAIDSGSCVIS